MSLRTKLLILFIILALIPLGIAGRSMIWITRDELKSSANEKLMMVASQVTQIVDDFYRYACLNPLLLAQKTVQNANLGVNEKISSLTEGMKNATDIVALQISVEGVPSPLLVIKDEFSDNLKKSFLDAASVLKLTPSRVAALLKGDEIFVGDLTVLPEGDIWLITIILPLEESTFGRPATLSARINLAHLRTRIERIKNHPLYKKVFITLIDREGRKIFDRDRPDLSRRALVETAKRILASQVRTIGAEPYVRPSGEKMLGAYSFPSTMDFGVIVEEHEAVAYEAVTKMVRSLIVWIIIGFFIAAVGAIVVSVSLTRPLRRLTRAARIISEGDLTVHIEGTNKKDEIGELSSAFQKMLGDLQQYIDQLTVTTKAKERAESELKLARSIQESFLPKKFPRWKKIEIWGKCVPAREVGGDYFDFFQIDEDNYGMVIGDVSGKGVPAALFMAVSRTLFRILSSDERSPDRVLTEFNDRLVALDQGSNMFITLFYGVFNDKTHRLLYSSAGHNMPYVKGPRGSEGNFQMLPSMKTMVAGIMEGISMSLDETHLRRSGDTIALYTDGMTEADNPDGEAFGEKRLEKLLDNYSDRSAQEMCEVLIKEVKRFQAGRPQFDDMTMLILKIR